jgi:hypothetical protein
LRVNGKHQRPWPREAKRCLSARRLSRHSSPAISKGACWRMRPWGGSLRAHDRGEKRPRQFLLPDYGGDRRSDEIQADIVSLKNMAIRERLLSPQSSSRPKQEHQNNRPNNTPADPCDVGVSRLPFENLLMNGHQECPSLSLTSILQIVASFCQIFSAAAAMPVTRRRKDHYRKFSSSWIGAARAARSHAIMARELAVAFR